MIAEQEIRDRVKRIMMEDFEIPEEHIIPQATLFAQIGLDSLDSVDLVVALEKEFGFKINRIEDEEKIRSMRMLKDVYSFIKYKLGMGPFVPESPPRSENE